MKRLEISIRDFLLLMRDLYFFIDPGYIRKSDYGIKGIFSKIFPRLHFIIFGFIQKSNPNVYFDAEEFSSKFPVGSLSFRYPVLKYLTAAEGQRPQIMVDSVYVSKYADVRSFRRSPLTHFFRYGKSEGRSIQLDKIESISHENRLWYTYGRTVYPEKAIQIEIDSCESVDYFLDIGENRGIQGGHVVISSHSHKQEFTPLSNSVSVGKEGDKFAIKCRIHTDLIFDKKHLMLFLDCVLNDFENKDIDILDRIETYFKKLGYESESDFYVDGNQTFSAKTFNYINQSRIPVSVHRKNLEIETIRKILLISHDDSLSGAPLFALQIYRQMVAQSFQVQLLVLKRISSSSAKSAFSDSTLNIVYLEDALPKMDVSIEPHSAENYLGIAYKSIFASFKPDIVIANTVVSADGAVRAAVAGIPSVLLVHETWGFKAEGLPRYSPQEIAIRESFESANLVVFGSNAAREKWQDSKLSPNSLVLPSHRVINPTNRMKSAEKKELRFTLGIPEHAFVYLSIGSFEERKRTLDAIHSFVAFSSDSDFLVLVGDWSLNDSYCSAVRKQASKFINIKIIGTTPDLERYYFTADCFILMSASEVYPLVLQEAAAYGLPRIISKFDGFKECVESINSALFYETGDLEKLTELMQLIRDSSEMREAIIRESQYEVHNNEAEASQYIDRLFNRLATPHVTSLRIAIND